MNQKLSMRSARVKRLQPANSSPSPVGQTEAQAHPFEDVG
jgi:hypothetical protein